MGFPSAVDEVDAVRDDPFAERTRVPKQQPQAADVDAESTASQTVLLATVAAAFVTVAASVLITTWAYSTATGSSEPRSPNLDPVFELRDKLVWLVAAVSAGVLGLLFSWVRRPVERLIVSWQVLAVTVVGMTGVALSGAWVDPNIGLGPENLVLAVTLVPVLILAVGPSPGPRTEAMLRYLGPALTAIGGALYLPALWQTPRGMYDALHGARNIDELLGPVAGNFPLSDYIPQYGGMLGLPLVPFRTMVAANVEWWITSYLSVLSLATVAAVCAAAALILPSGRRVLAWLLVVPVLLMKPSSPDRLIPAGLQRLFQTMPERSLLPVCMGVLLLLAAMQPQSRRRWLWAGAVSSLAALNNFESGATAAVTAVLTLIVLRAGWRALGYFMAGLVSVTAAYALLLVLAGGNLRPEYWVAFSLEFAEGFANLPMPPYGNYVLLLFVLVASAASAFAVLRRGAGSLTAPAAGGLYFGVWGLLMFPYYVGRSSSLGQLQFFFIPASVAAVWLLMGAAKAARGLRPSPRLAYAVLLCCLPAALFATTVIKAPSPEFNQNRLSGGFAPAGVFRSTAWKVVPVVDASRARIILEIGASAHKPVGLFFTSGNVAALRTGLPNASVLAVPEELMAPRPWSGDPEDKGNASFRRLQCQSLTRSSLNSVIAEDLIATGLDTCTDFTRGPSGRGLVVFSRKSAGATSVSATR